MSKMISLTIDGQKITAPEGMLIVDAAKKVGIHIPVFCYHPKMEPVGMCRMCLVDIGRPAIDRTTGQNILEADGSLKIQFGAKLETACTTPVSEGMVVVGLSDKVKAARKEVIEFLLTSHPLDCPICDKGGECPLQNLTMGYGTGDSRFLLGEKQHFLKKVPLGELIILDRERCIQCARCVRFQTDVVDDPVIGFYKRGRQLEIITCSEPGFDSYFSGNTTDICPVGALTTADFRFGARPWEMKTAASICTHCPVGCNTTVNIRREVKSEGKVVIKRIMPRQNEGVNELWMCDKGRFVYQFAESSDRLTKPLVRKDGKLTETSWDEALQIAANGLKAAGKELLVLAGGRLANEDLFNLSKMTSGQGKNLLYSHLAGGDLVSRYGMTSGSNFSDMGKGTAIVVVASDLHEEAPVWWLRVKQAAERGATLITIHPRKTRLDRFAAFNLKSEYGEITKTLAGLLPGAKLTKDSDAEKSAQAVQQAENLVIIYGGEGQSLVSSQELAAVCADLLEKTNHTGKVNNGLIAVWANGNTQGAWEMGFKPDTNLEEKFARAKSLLIAGTDPAGDDPVLAAALLKTGFVVVQELFLTETAKLADVVFPAAPVTEREGTFTSGERRVQRFYPAVPPRPDVKPDFKITALLAEKMGMPMEGRAASLVFTVMAAGQPAFAGLSYPLLAETGEQWPVIGREDVYYGGTSYDNHQGLGRTLAPAGVEVVLQPVSEKECSSNPVEGTICLVPVTRLYDSGSLMTYATLLEKRIAPAAITLNPKTAEAFKLSEENEAELLFNETWYPVSVKLDEKTPEGVGLVPLSVGLPVFSPQQVSVRIVEKIIKP
jgi:NADH-quinone oxidoreductase subunit G